MDQVLKRQSVIVIIIVAAFFVLTFIFNIWNGSEAPSPANTEPPLAGSSTPNTFFAFKNGTGLPKLPLPRPNVNEINKSNKVPENMMTFIGRVGTAVNQVEKKIMAESIRQTASTAPKTSTPQTTTSPISGEIVLNLTPDEFHYLYPDYILNIFVKSQRFIKESDASFTPLNTLENDSQVRLVQEKLFNYFLSAKIIDSDTYSRAVITLRYTLPQLQLGTLAARKIVEAEQSRPLGLLNRALRFAGHMPDFVKTISEGYKTPRSQETDMSPNIAFYSGLLAMIEKITTAPTANAIVCTPCQFRPECFMEGGLFDGKRGVESATVFCDCRTSNCFYGQGCIDRCLPFASIWDPLTLTCGCGGPPVAAGTEGEEFNVDLGEAGSGGGGGTALTPDEQLLHDNVDKLVTGRFGGDYQAAFNHYASNGGLGVNQLKNLLSDANVGNFITRGTWADEIIKRFDTNGDKLINWVEFNTGIGK